MAETICDWPKSNTIRHGEETVQCQTENEFSSKRFRAQLVPRGLGQAGVLTPSALIRPMRGNQEDGEIRKVSGIEMGGDKYHNCWRSQDQFAR